MPVLHQLYEEVFCEKAPEIDGHGLRGTASVACAGATANACRNGGGADSLSLPLSDAKAYRSLSPEPLCVRCARYAACRAAKGVAGRGWFRDRRSPTPTR